MRRATAAREFRRRLGRVKRLAVLVLLALAATSRAAEDDVAKARAEFDAIVQYRDPRENRAGGPSLTSLVQMFLAHGQTVATTAESAAWDASTRADLFASRLRNRIESTIEFLHELPQNAGLQLFELTAGAVIDRQYSGSGGNGGWKAPETFEKLVKGRPLRSVAAPDATALLAEIAKPEFAKWHEPTRLTLDTALGEACTRDNAAFAMLTARAARPDVDLTIAIGWSRRPEAVAFLDRRLRDLLAATPNPAVGFWLDPFDAAAIGLHYADADAFDRLVASLPAAQGDRVAAAIGGPVLSRRLLAGVGGATDEAARRAAMLQLCDSVSALSDGRLRGAGFERVLRALLDATTSPDERVSKAALIAAARALYAVPSDTDHPSRSSQTIDGVTESEELVRLAWPGPVVALLRQVVADLESGRLVTVDQPPSLFESRPSTLVSPGDGDTKSADPVGVSAKWAVDGLRISIRNVGPAPIAVDAVGLGYCDAWLAKRTTDRSGTTSPVDRVLRLYLGRCPVRSIAPSRALIVLAPGAVHEWTLPIRSELRSVDHVQIGSESSAIVGPSAAPLAAVRWSGAP
jgi:hypothetical protein